MRKKKRENSAIPQGRKSRRKASKSRSIMSKSNNKRAKPQKSYNQMKTLPVTGTQDNGKESSSIVDEFCKDLYDFLGESRTESQSKSPQETRGPRALGEGRG